MPRQPVPPLRAGDLVAVRLGAGPVWADLAAGAWEARAALLPLDERLTAAEAGAVVARARPTAVLDGEGFHRRHGGVATEGETALVMSSSGSSGVPRLVELSRSAVASAVEASAAALGPRARQTWLSCLPPAHIGGLLVVLRSVLLGVPVVIHERFDPARVAGERDVVCTSLVATMLVRLLDLGADLRRFDTILVGGAAMPDGLAGRAAAAGARCTVTYGQTQSCGGVVYDGRPLPGVAVRTGSSDEVEMGGATLMRGYRLDPQATAEAFTIDGWLRTGDAGSLDASGRLTVTGRLDDAIVTGGEKVWPDAVEAVLRRHPAVADTAVVGHPDREWGQRVVAVVVPADPAAPPTLDELRDHVAGSLPRFAAPRELRLAGSLPRTALGKMRRAQVRESLIERGAR